MIVAYLRKITHSIGLVMLLFIGHAPLIAQSASGSKQQIENNISVTIDKHTTNGDFKSISDMLSEYNIIADFENIERNSNNEITQITIELSSNRSQTSSTTSSNNPIKDITFGSKNGNLYIGDDNSSMGSFSLSNGSRHFNFPFASDSIFGQLGSFNLDDFFNGNSNLFIFNGDSINLDSLQNQLFGKLKFNNGREKVKSYNDNESDYYQYNFVDDPNKDTLIVIDGKISDFKTLDNLAKANNIKTVDVLQPETAMSIYGDKAKDGAIIATTK